jgi:hypothetical protein
VIVDLTARSYLGTTIITQAIASGCPVLAVGQHDDVDGRRAALDAGADRFLAYRRLVDDGPGLLRGWLGGDRPSETLP